MNLSSEFLFLSIWKSIWTKFGHSLGEEWEEKFRYMTMPDYEIQICFTSST